MTKQNLKKSITVFKKIPREFRKEKMLKMLKNSTNKMIMMIINAQAPILIVS